MEVLAVVGQAVLNALMWYNQEICARRQLAPTASMRHLKPYMFQNKLLISMPKSALPTASPSQQMAAPSFQLLRPNIGVLNSSLLHLTFSQLINPVGSTSSLCPESNHFHHPSHYHIDPTHHYFFPGLFQQFPTQSLCFLPSSPILLKSRSYYVIFLLKIPNGFHSHSE